MHAGHLGGQDEGLPGYVERIKLTREKRFACTFLGDVQTPDKVKFET